jgi:benzoate membrane transport protein
MATSFELSAARVRRPPIAIELNARNVAAGLAATLTYALGPAPLYLAAADDLVGDERILVAGFFVAFATAGLVTIALALRYRQPLAVGWSLPGLVYMAALAPGHSLGQIMGASILAGVIVVALGVTGLAERLMRAAPLPVIMGVTAGSMLAYVTRPFAEFSAAPVAIGAAVVGFFIAKRAGKAWLPPVAGALLLALPLLAAQGDIRPAGLELSLPDLAPVTPAFSVSTMLALSLPLVLLTLAGNAQGFAILEMYGHRPPRGAVTAVTGGMSIVHAFFGAPPASLQRMTLGLFAGEDSGPAPARYWGAIVASIGALGLAFAAASASAFTNMLPAALVNAVVGLILLGVLLDALRATLGEPGTIAGFLGFVVAASGMTALGIEPTFWGLAIGVAAAYLVDPRPAASRAATHAEAPAPVPLLRAFAVRLGLAAARQADPACSTRGC